MKKRIRGMTSASRGEKEGKREREEEMNTVEREWQNGVSERRAIVLASRREAAKNEEGGGPFRACGNSFVRKTRRDGKYDDEKREAVDQPVGRMNEWRRERRKCEGAHRVGSRRR